MPSSPIFSPPGAYTWLSPPLPPPPPPAAITSSATFHLQVGFLSFIFTVVFLLFYFLYCFHQIRRLNQTRRLDIEERLSQANELRILAEFQADMVRQRRLAAAHRRRMVDEEEEASSSATTTVAYKDVEAAEDGDCDCAICIEGFKEEEICRVVESCGHFFHEDCVDEWLKIESRCPLCRCLVHVVSENPNENQA